MSVIVCMWGKGRWRSGGGEEFCGEERTVCRGVCLCVSERVHACVRM